MTDKKIEIKVVKISDIKSNPNNPRIIKDDKFKKLVESIKGFPEMANVRPIVVNTDMIVLGGNMRLKAMKEAGWKEAPIQIVDWDEQKQKEFIVKDNVGFGEWDWDELANNWDESELNDWALDVWVNKEGIFLGHDNPNYKVDRDFFYNQRLWCHAKNLEALEYLLSINTKCFYHNIDDYTLTSNGLIWTYPGENVNNKSIIVDLSKDWNTKNYNCFGVCVDYIL